MPRDPQRIEDFIGTYPSDMSTLPPARSAFADWMRTWLDERAADDFHDDMLIVMSELVANAMDGTPGHETVDLLACVRPDGLVLEVTNALERPHTPVTLWDFDDPLRHGGRGLMIVTSLVDEINIDSPPDGGSITVWCRRRV